MKRIILNFCVSLYIVSLGFGIDVVVADGLDYPELVVTPRASERVKMESRNEFNNRFFRYIPVQIPAVTTLLSTSFHENTSKDDSSMYKLMGYTVSGGWIAASVAMAMWYQPFQTQIVDMNSMPQKSQREQLFKERMAEETITSAGKLDKTINILSFASNFLVNGLFIARSVSDSNSRMYAGIGLLASFTPLFFPTYYATISDHHMDYKKKIYGPIAQLGVVPIVTTQEVFPALALSVRY